MAIQIKLKNSVVQDSTPSTSDLPAVGEIALNANINSIGGFMRASDNTIVKIFGPGSLSTPTATTTVSGISELATNSETTTGTATNRVVTPAGLNAVTVAERTTSNSTYLALAGGTMTGVLQVTAGSSSAPAIHFGDSDSGIYAASGGNNVRIAVGGSDAISASTGGGINFVPKATALTSLTLGSQSATDKSLFFADANSVESASLLLDNSSNEFRVRNNRFSGKIVFAPSQNTEKARIDNAGRLLVGTSSSNNVAGFGGSALQVEGTTGATSSMSLIRHSANNVGSTILFGKSRGTSNGATTIVQNNDIVARIFAYGADGTDTESQLAGISYEVDGTPGANDMPGRLVFSTTADGASSSTTRLTIDSAGLVKIPDNGKFVAGTGGDLQIFHDDPNSIIRDINDNPLWIQTDGAIRLTKDSATAYYATFNPGGAVELYFDGSKKLQTTSTGINIGGNQATNPFDFLRFGASLFGAADIRPTNEASHKVGLSFYTDGTPDSLNPVERFIINSSGNVQIPADNKELQIGASQDLQLFHDGSDSNIYNASGNLRIRAANNLQLETHDGEMQIKCVEDGAVELFFDNAQIFRTEAAGIVVSGNCRLPFDGHKILLGASQDLQILHDGTDNLMNTVGTVLAVHRATSNAGNPVFEVRSNHGATNQIKFQVDGDGDVLIPTDTGKLQLGVGQDLSILHDGSESSINNTSGSFIVKNSSGSLTLSSTVDVLLRPANGELGLKSIGNGATELYFDTAKKFETTSNGAACTGILESSNQGNILNQTHSALILKSSTNAAMRANFLLQDDFPSGSGSLAINVTEAGVSNDRALLLNRSGGFVGVRCTPTVPFEVSGASKFLNDVNHEGHIVFPDAKEIRLGGNTDLRLYHDGHSIIRNDETGAAFFIASHETIMSNTSFTEAQAKFIQNGAAELYFDNGKKLKTISEGVKVTELQIAPSGTETGALVNFAGGGCSTNADGYSYFFERATAGTNTNAFTFRSGSLQTHVGTINFNNSQTMYNTTSDYRLKENAVSISDGITRLKTLKPYRFNFKGETDIVDGFFAHEVTPAVPEAISGTKDEVDSKGNPVLQGIDQSKLVPLLVAAVQELIGRVEKLEAA